MPVDTVARVVPQLIKTGQYNPPVLGIEIDNQINRRLVSALSTEGVFVLGVRPNSVAVQVCLQGPTRDRTGSIVPGDIVLSIYSQSVPNVVKVISTLDTFKPGQAVSQSIRHGKQALGKPVRLQAAR